MLASRGTDAARTASCIAVGYTSVGRLRRVDVIVGMHRAVPTDRRIEQLIRTVRDHLVGVHVRRRATAALNELEWEGGVVLTRGDLPRGPNDGVSELRRERTELGVGSCGGGLDVAEPSDQRWLAGKGDTRDGEVCESTSRVDTPQRVTRHAQLAESVSLEPGLVARHGGEL